MLQRSTYYLILIVFFFSCKKQQTPDSSGIFELLTSETTGVDFINSIENTASLNILNYLYFYNGAGVSVGDFNNDGLTDIYFTANQIGRASCRERV